MKILVIHATAGAGHRKAAEAVFNGIKTHTRDEVQCVNVLDYTSPFYKASYQKVYMALITYAPWLWGFFFYLIDIRPLLRIVQGLRRFFNAINARKLRRFLIQEKFDCIISTHFMANEIASSLKGQGLIKAKIICVVTDYDAHSIWLARHVDHYAVACEYTQKKLVSLGVPLDKICITGIPTDEKFSQALDRADLSAKLGLRGDLFTVLLATGSFGIGPIEEILEALHGVQSIVICGHNAALHERLSAKKNPFVKSCGFVDNMHEFMAVSDVMITKPGGLSISEALVRGLALIFFSAIPGQETNNVKVLGSYGIGLKAQDASAMVAEINKLKSSPDYYLSIKKRTKALARPGAVSDIIKLVV